MRNTIIKTLLGLIISATAFGGAGTLALKFQEILNLTKAAAAKAELKQVAKFLDEEAHDATLIFGISKNNHALIMLDGSVTRGANNASLRLAIFSGKESARVTEEAGYALQRLLRADGVKIEDDLISVYKTEVRGIRLNDDIGVESFSSASVSFAQMDAAQVANLLDRALLVIKTLDSTGVEGLKALGKTAAKVESKYQF